MWLVDRMARSSYGTRSQHVRNMPLPWQPRGWWHVHMRHLATWWHVGECGHLAIYICVCYFYTICILITIFRTSQLRISQNTASISREVWIKNAIYFVLYCRGLDNKVTVYPLSMDEDVTVKKRAVGTHSSYMSCCTFPYSDQQVRCNGQQTGWDSHLKFQGQEAAR